MRFLTESVGQGLGGDLQNPQVPALALPHLAFPSLQFHSISLGKFYEPDTN